MRSLGDALAEVAADLGLGDVGTAGEIAARWEELVGRSLAVHVRPVRLRDGVLVVQADSPGWASQLRYLGADVAERVNSALGREVVVEVRVAVGRPKGATTRDGGEVET